MRHRSNSGKRIANWKSGLGTAALAAGFLMFTASPGAKAEDCQERLMHADHKLHEAIDHHGVESKQADKARHELHDAREYCWTHEHRWWDVEGNRWHTDRDWDEHDHDHHP